MKKAVEIKFPDFNGNLTQFLDHIDSINETLPFVMALISMVDKERERELQDFIKSRNLKKETTKVKDTSDTAEIKEEDVVSLKFEDFLVFEGLQNNSQVSSLAIKLIPESLFVTLISQFDAFIGKLIKTISETINTEGNRSNEVVWDGKDDHGNKIGRGVYVYRLEVSSINGKASKYEKLVILR